MSVATESTSSVLPRSSVSTTHFTMGDFLHQLGDISPDRVHLRPAPGTATLEEAADWNELRSPPCEWIDGTLVEKPVMGQFEGSLTFILLGELYQYLTTHDLGLVYPPDVILRILPEIGRAPDVSFVPWSAFPGSQPPPREVRVPEVVPALAIEVISHTNRRAEMTRKRREYFRAGVQIVWEVDPGTRTVRVYTSVDEFTTLGVAEMLDCPTILPGFSLSVGQMFDRASRRRTV